MSSGMLPTKLFIERSRYSSLEHLKRDVGNPPGMRFLLKSTWVRLVRSHVKGGMVCVMLALTRVNPVTEPLVVLQVISGQEQWDEVFDVFSQWLRKGGFCR